jgi:hypothetical protein
MCNWLTECQHVYRSLSRPLAWAYGLSEPPLLSGSPAFRIPGFPDLPGCPEVLRIARFPERLQRRWRKGAADVCHLAIDHHAMPKGTE